jgi:hypothetical protein
MTIGDLWMKTTSDPSLMWTALGVGLQMIQTIMVLVSAVVVVLQIKQLRRDSTEKRISGLKTAIEALDTDLFRQVSKQVREGKTVQGANWRKLLESIKLVAVLIHEEYTSEKLLFAMKGQELYDLSEYFKKNPLPVDLKEDLKDQFKPAIDLLDRINRQGKKLGFAE